MKWADGWMLRFMAEGTGKCNGGVKNDGVMGSEG